MSELVAFEEQATHVLLRLDDGKANALSFAVFEELNAGLDRAAGAGKPVVIAGRPGRFSAGFDLTVMAGGGDPVFRLLRQGADLAVRLLSFDTPVVLAVSGHALAMGALLCLSADYRIGIEGPFKLGLNEVAIGMTLPWFGIVLARARLEETQLTRAVALARIYAPGAAVDAGYLDEVVAPEQLDARVEEVVAGFAALNMTAYRQTKLRLREDLLTQLQAALGRDFGEGLGIAASGD